MKYEEFKERYIEIIEEQLNEIGITQSLSFQKMGKVNNDNEAIVFMCKDDNIGPVIDLDAEYNSWELSDKTIDEFVNGTVVKITRAIEDIPKLPEFSFENMRTNMICDAINISENSHILHNVPHRKLGDIAIIPRWIIEDGCSTVVSNAICRLVGKQPEEMLDTAYQNTMSGAFDIQSLSSLLGLEDFEEGNSLYVVKRPDNMYGAAAIACSNVMERVSQELGGDFYIIPSSRHELLALSKNSDATVKDLEHMIRAVNATEVSKSDFLSNRLYEYDAANKQVQLANTEERMIKRGRSR